MVPVEISAPQVDSATCTVAGQLKGRSGFCVRLNFPVHLCEQPFFQPSVICESLDLVSPFHRELFCQFRGVPQLEGRAAARDLSHALPLPASGQDPVHPIIRHMNLVLQPASRCVGVSQAQI